MSSSDEDIALSMKKKKKKKAVKKRAVDSDDEDGSDVSPAVKPSASPEVQAASPIPAAEDIDEEDMTLEQFYAMLKVTKKRKRKDVQAVTVDGAVDWDALQSDDREYHYAEILSRVYDRIKQNNPQLGVKQVHKIRPPNVVRDGTKKVAWTNFPDICKSLNRSQEHVFNYTLTELGTTGNVDGNNCLIIKGRLNATHIENLLRKYISTYVTCEMCHSTNTQLQKDPNTRLTTLQCGQCGAARTVQSITGGFSAQIGRRKRK